MTANNLGRNQEALSTISERIPFGLALKFWIKLGFISFGGPAGQISIMHQELVNQRRWISEQRFLHALNFTMLLPGPEAQQLATYLGWLCHGIKGGLAAGLLFVLPSFFILSILAWIYLVYGQAELVQAILYGMKPAVTAVVLFAAYRIGTRALSNLLHWGIMLAALFAMTVLSLPFPYIVFGAAFIGIIIGQLRPTWFSVSHMQNTTEIMRKNKSIIDDDTPLPPHARFKWSRLVSLLFVGLASWFGGMAVLILVYGWDATLTQMGWFFTKAALLTFGGAYAVLPYVYQGSIETYGWSTASQMMDGLALGEATPGPLIMIVTFIGFIGGWSKEIFGSDTVLLAGFVAAAVTTFFTFLPSFLFILIGAPAIEATRDDLRFTAPLSAITSAVVGVILTLAGFFAYHVLFPGGENGHFDWPAAILGLAALVGLIKYRLGVINIIALASLTGLAYKLIF